MKSILLHIFSLLLFVTAIEASVGLDYLNSLRTSAGMPAFTSQDNLDNAAQNHSDYMKANNVFGHYEDSTKTGFTGDYAPSRAVYAGYQNSMVSENVSAGQSSIESSIDGLMSAIYHRFGFLSLEVDEVGIGVNNTFYTFDMGNSVLNALCTNESYASGSYYQPCADTTIKVESADYEGRSDTIKAASPDLIKWPNADGADIPPVFYEEYPDPLPNDSVTGYPVSVEFNRATFISAPSVSSFVLKDANDLNLDSLIIMDKTNDPNGRFSEYQFALFPKKRLEWGSAYNVDFTYIYEDNTYSEHWCFTTHSLSSIANKYYKIENNADITLSVISGESYAIYIVPTTTNDSLGGVSYSYNSDAPTFSYIDSNTITITLTGSVGEYTTFSFGNGQKIKLIIDTLDKAIKPKQDTCLSDIDGDGVADIYDAFPDDASESVDTDNDGTGNNADTDDDNDGVLDANDAFPLDASETLDTDNDGTGNNADTDDDNDGVLDANDAFPLDSSESVDTDGDGTGNNADTDDDNDGVLDANDAFPLDSSESVDTDNDGTGNNADTDDDNDGVLDANDAFPLDSSESVDTDGDGTGNNADTDDDNDGISDSDELANGLNPLNASDAQADFDADGFSNAIEISVGTDIRSATSKPVWAPVMMGDIMIFIPSV